MKNFLITLYLISIFWTRGHAFNVEKFTLDPFDVSAVTYPRITDEDEEAALVKISLPLKNVEVNGNIVGSVEQVNGEYWVYLDPGSISLTITGEDGQDIDVRFADFGIPLVGKSCTYKLECKLTPHEQTLAFENHKRVEKVEHKTPRHLAVAYTYKGERFYMTQKEWIKQQDLFFHNIEIEGFVIEYGDKMFILLHRQLIDENYNYIRLNWNDTKKYLINHPDERLMTKSEAEYLLSIQDDLEKASEDLFNRGTPPITYAIVDTWLSDYINDNKALVVGGMKNIFPVDKSYERVIKTVIDIKQ